MRNLVSFISFLVCILQSDTKGDTSGHVSQSLITLQNRENLDDEGKVVLGWEFDPVTQIITFEIEAATTGFVGFGISPMGSMSAADIFIAGVYPNGSAYFFDCFGVGLTTPKIDEHSDWVLTEARESIGTNGTTFLRFERLINTCDEEDYPIQNGTTRIIWSLGASDEIGYHGADNRGTQSVTLLGVPTPDLDTEGLQRWEMTVEIEIPPLETTYWCSFHKGPVVYSKHHIVSFGAVVQSALEKKHTHHFVLYNCHLPPDSDEDLDTVFRNYTVDTGFLGGHCHITPPGQVPMPDRHCTEMLSEWAVGGKSMILPENVGYPIGTPENAGKQLYYMLEMHYDNPTKSEGLVVNSGAEFYYTNKTRQEDAGLLEVGYGSNILLTIPPNSTNFTIRGDCPAACTTWGIERPEGITIVNVMLHAHISGRKLKARHFRYNVELPWIGVEDNFDFNYQQNSPIEPIILLPGDRIQLECTYDNMWNNGKVVVGGMSTREEMCKVFMWYYPKQELEKCEFSYPQILHALTFGVTAYHEEDTPEGYVMVIDEPEYLRGPYPEAINRFNWSDQFIANYQQARLYGRYDGFCRKRPSGESLETTSPYPIGFDRYEPEDVCRDSTR